MSFGQKVFASRHLIPVVSLITIVLGGIYSGIATATEAAALGVGGALLLAKIAGALDWWRRKPTTDSTSMAFIFSVLAVFYGPANGSMQLPPENLP